MGKEKGVGHITNRDPSFYMISALGQSDLDDVAITATNKSILVSTIANKFRNDNLKNLRLSKNSMYIHGPFYALAMFKYFMRKTQKDYLYVVEFGIWSHCCVLVRVQPNLDGSGQCIRSGELSTR